MSSRAVIFANGSLPDLEAARSLVRPGDALIAADGGTRHCLALGLMPDIILGDFDSIPPDVRDSCAGAGVRILQYPRDKNETDLELALDFAVGQEYSQIIILAALGGRLDHTLGNLSLLTNLQLVPIDVRFDDGVEEAFFVRGQARIQGKSGDLVSLIPWGMDVYGVHTLDLRWPLNGDILRACQTRGISNELLGETAAVRIESGLLLVVHHRQS